MTVSKAALIVAALLPVAAECEQSYRVYTQHPRLWLDARRLRLLRRERERDSIRWQQLQLLIQANKAMAEEPLVRALLYKVADDQESGKQAVRWAIQRAAVSGAPDAAELRLLAVVFDWCDPLIEESDRGKIVQRMARGIAAARQADMQSFAATVLAAIATADDWSGSEEALTEAFEKRWKQQFLPALREGRAIESPADRVAFMEMCHAVRESLNIDLWQQAPAFFRQFPAYLLLQYYPAPIEVAGHRFRQMATSSMAKSDPALLGELGRVTEMVTAAYDTNSVETQFLQGWITHDIYRLRTPTGTVYEFLWMNPYQPGLTYYNVPLYVHDEIGGTLLARSSWDDDAAWIGYFHGELQLFADGERSLINPADQTAPILFPHVAIVPRKGDSKFQVRVAEGEDVFVVGLEQDRTYWVKAGDRKFAAQPAGKGGILHLTAEPGSDTAFDLRTADPNPPPPTLEKKSRKRN